MAEFDAVGVGESYLIPQKTICFNHLCKGPFRILLADLHDDVRSVNINLNSLAVFSNI